jgi:hypothetical protein
LPRPGDANFTDLLHGNLWNRLIPDRAPQVLVRINDEQDVVAAVLFARANKLKVVVRCSSRQIRANLGGPSDGGILADLLILLVCFTGPVLPPALPDAVFSMTARIYAGPSSQWKSEGEDEANTKWHNALIADLAPFNNGYYYWRIQHGGEAIQCPQRLSTRKLAGRRRSGHTGSLSNIFEANRVLSRSGRYSFRG